MGAIRQTFNVSSKIMNTKVSPSIFSPIMNTHCGARANGCELATAIFRKVAIPQRQAFQAWSISSILYTCNI